MSNPLSDIAEIEPQSFTAGDTVTWKRSDLSADYPADEWTLVYRFRPEGATTSKTVTCTNDNGDFLALISATESATYDAGVYHWSAYATRTSDSARVTVGTGLARVDADPANSTADPRSHAAKVLAALDALIEGRATNDVQSYAIAGRSLTRMSMDELLRWRATYREQVRAERAVAQGKSAKRITRVQFP